VASSTAICAVNQWHVANLQDGLGSHVLNRAAMKAIIPLLFLCLLSSTGFSQNTESGQLTEMKKLSFLLGQWKGDGYFEYAPGQRRTFTETENVQAKLGGLMIVFEGSGQSKPASGEEVTVHSALGLARYDDQSKAFRWQAYRADRGSVLAIDTPADVGNQTLQWGYQDNPHGQVRFSIKLDEKGDWFEVGEISSDGQTWKKFMEMTLQRID
jgi:hypothetical protein